MCRAVVAADDAERKVALLLEHGVRADRRAAEDFAAAPALRRLSVAGFQHRIELLRMYGCALNSFPVNWFRADLQSRMLPLLAFLVKHECASPSGLAIGMPCYRSCAACGSCFAISMIVQAHCCLAAQTKPIRTAASMPACSLSRALLTSLICAQPCMLTSGQRVDMPRALSHRLMQGA